MTTPPTTLIALLGLSPGVLTESLYEVTREGTKVDRVIVLTTSTAARGLLGTWAAGESLDHPLEPAVTRLLRSLLGCLARDMRSPRLDELDLQVRIAADGRGPLADVQTTEDAETFARLTWDVVREERRAGHRLIASIAGGRKTMGATLQQAMTLLGHPTDRVVHVLVEPAFEKHWFLYPGQTSVVEDYEPVLRSFHRDQKPPSQDELRASGAKVVLHEVRLAALGPLLPDAHVQAPLDEVIERAERLIDAAREPTVDVHPEVRQVFIDGEELAIPARRKPAVLSFLLMCASSKLNACEKEEQDTCGHCSCCHVDFLTLAGDWEDVREQGPESLKELETLKLWKWPARRLVREDPSYLRSPVGIYVDRPKLHPMILAAIPDKPTEALRKTRQTARRYLKEALSRFAATHAAWSGREERLFELLDFGVGNKKIGIALDRGNLRLAGKPFKRSGT